MTVPIHLNGKRILVVEDETLIAMELAAILEEAGAEVIGPANSIEQAHTLIAAQSLKVQAALLDINVAGASIESVAEALSGAGVPYAFTTGYGSAEVTEASPQVPVLRKPFTPTQVLSVLKMLCG